MHQILLQVMQNSYRNVQAVKEAICHLSGRIHYLWPQEGQRCSSVKCLLIYFFSAWNCLSQICSTGTNCEPTFLHRYFCNVHRKARDRNCLRGGTLGISFSIMAVHLSHSVLSLQEFLTNNGMIVAPHPQRCPCLAPYNIFVFLKLRLALKRRKFHGIIMIQEQNSYHLHVEFQTEDIKDCL